MDFSIRKNEPIFVIGSAVRSELFIGKHFSGLVAGADLEIARRVAELSGRPGGKGLGIWLRYCRDWR
jgi:hypothetical protein